MRRMGGGISWIYQARRVCTRATNDGLTVIDVSVATGQIARLITCAQVNSGTNDIVISLMDEDNARKALIAEIASGAGKIAYRPSDGVNVTTSGAQINSKGLIIPAGAKLRFAVSGNGANGDTVTVDVTLELFNLSTEPTWSIAASTGTAPTLAASTISAANTITLGRVWT